MSAETHTAFISFSSRDEADARLVCKHLEAGGIRCWLSSRDVRPGENYQAAIVRGIQTAKIMVLIFSDHTNRSDEVHKELSLASAFKVQVMPVRIADVRPQGALLYELATRQWIDIFKDRQAALRRLIATAQNLLGGSPAEGAGAELVPPESDPGPAQQPAADPLPTFSPTAEERDAARAALAHYIGPLADLLVRKASKTARSLHHFHEQLVGHIGADEQDAFRRRLQQRHSTDGAGGKR